MMQTAVFLGKETIRPQSSPIPSIQDNEVLIKVKAAGICGTDVHIYYGSPGATTPTLPVVLGHEFAGEVVQTGPQVHRLHVGDRVTVDPNMYCGNCDPCHNGKKQFCEHMSAIGVNQNGGFEQYCAVPESQAIRLPDDVDFECGAFAEPVACALHGIDNIQIRPGDSVVVIGGGAIGQIMCQLARLSGASSVILSEPVEMRRSLALSLGADGAIDPTKDDLALQLEAISGTKDADVIIECVGKPAAIQQALSLARRGGRILIFSVPSPTDTVALPLQDVFQKELTIKGSFVNPDTQKRAASLIGAGLLQLKPLISHRYPIHQLEEAIQMQMSADSVKVMIIPEME